MSGSQRLGEFSFFKDHPKLLYALAENERILTLAELNEFVRKAATQHGTRLDAMADTQTAAIFSEYVLAPRTFHNRAFTRALCEACRYAPGLKKIFTKDAWPAHKAKHASTAITSAPKAPATTVKVNQPVERGKQPARPKAMRRAWIERPAVFAPEMLSFLRPLETDRRQWNSVEAAVAAALRAPIARIESTLREIRQGYPFSFRQGSYQLKDAAGFLVEQRNARCPDLAPITVEAAYNLEAFLTYEQAPKAAAPSAATPAVPAP